ncbi:MAG: porin family protein [Bacteroidales bacterium]|nr:porin family protein [Bacteroidales bacterium]
MRKKLIITLTLLATCFSFSYAQVSFGVSPGLKLNSAYFGYKIKGKFVPFIGFQYLNANYTQEETGEKWDRELEKIVSYSDKDVYSGSLYIPNIGLKYFVKQNNKIQAYLSLCMSKPFLSTSIKYNGKRDKDVEKYVESINIWGGEFGFGVEYFFDENFSLGGEFGIRYLHFKSSESEKDEITNYTNNIEKEVDIKTTYNLNVSPTFSKISLNYYF